MKFEICVILYTLLVLAAAQGNETEVGASNGTTTQEPEVNATEQPIVETTTQEPEANTTEQPTVETTTEDYDNETMTTEMPFVNTTESEEVDEATVKPEPVVCSLSADLDGDWWSTLWGNVSVVDGQLFGVGIDKNEDTVLTCQANGDSGYLIFGEEPGSNSSDGDVFYTCIKFERRNQNNFHVQIKTARNLLLSNQPVVAMPYNQSVDDPKLVCNGMENMALQGELLRKGKEVEGALGCPDLLKGSFNQTFTDVASIVQCPDGAKMSSCEEPKTLSFDYTQCNTTGEYTANEKSVCVSGGSNQVTTLERVQDSPVFKCMVLSEDKSDPGSIDVTVTSGGCGDDWEADLPKKQENTYILVKTGECEAQTTTDGHRSPTPGGQEGGKDDDAGSSVGPSTLLVTGLVSLIFLVISRVH